MQETRSNEGKTREKENTRRPNRIRQEIVRRFRAEYAVCRGTFFGRLTCVREGKSVVSYLAVIRLVVSFTLFLTASLAEFPGGIYPVALAFCAAVGKPSGRDGVAGGRKAVFASGWALLGCGFALMFLGGRALLYLAVFLSTLCIRAVLSMRRFDEPQFIRIAVAGAAGLCASLSSALFMGMDAAAWGGVLLSVLLTPLFCYLFSGIYTDALLGPAGKHHFILKNVGESAVVFAALLSLSRLLIGSVSVGLLLATLLTLFAAYVNGPAAGGLCGFFLGVAGGAVYDAGNVCIILGCGGFLSGLFFQNPLFAAAVFFLASSALSVITLPSALLWSFLTDMLLAIALFYPLLPVLPPRRETVEEIDRIYLARDGMKVERAKNRIADLSRAFSSLSLSFSDLSMDMRRPRPEQIREMIRAVCTECCESCPASEACWGKEYIQTDEALGVLGTRLQESARLREENVPIRFQSKCVRFSFLLERINDAYRDMKRRRRRGDGTELLSAEYGALAGLLRETADGLDENLGSSAEGRKSAKKALSLLALDRFPFAVYGNRSPVVEVFGVSPERIGVTPDRIAEVFSEEFGCRFASPAFLYRGENAVMRMKKKRRFSLECAKAGRAKRGESQNGDTVTFFENDDECFFAVLCDGMGSGHDAALTSRLSGLVVQRLMTCVPTGVAPLEMLNNMLLAKPDESFATVDLLQIDLMDGIATFIKAGAAPTFVVREENLYKISSKTPPAGTLKTMRAEQTTLEICDGDVIVMVSDGLFDTEAQNEGLLRTLAFEMLPRPADMAKLLITRATDPDIGATDDMSAVVIRVREIT